MLNGPGSGKEDKGLTRRCTHLSKGKKKRRKPAFLHLASVPLSDRTKKKSVTDDARSSLPGGRGEGRIKGNEKKKKGGFTRTN